jgi:neutral ceramidase
LADNDVDYSSEGRHTMRTGSAILFLSLIIGVAPDGIAQSARSTSPLRVGAAKVDVTPSADQLTPGSHGILDRLYARAIVLDNGTSSAALITVDAISAPDPMWQAVTRQVETELGIPAVNVLLTATHTHSGGGPQSPDYVQKIVEAVRTAKQKLTPARVGYGTGMSYINVNRQILDPKTRLWREGVNHDGASDKTIAVLKFESVNGELIAVYYNYAVHAVIAGVLDQISGDIPGATSKYVEDSFDGSVVAVWSLGAAGDQNPHYFQQTYDLRDIRAQETARRGVDVSNQLPRGGQGFDRDDPRVAKLMNQQRQMVLSLGQILGEDVKEAVRDIERTESSAMLYGAQKTVTCAGRERTNTGRAGVNGTYKEGPPVEIRLSLLRVGDVMIGGVNAEVFNLIAQRLKRESPYKATMMATLTNGSARSGYIPDDASYTKNTFEVLGSRLQAGCAESSIVNGIVELMNGSRARE